MGHSIKASLFVFALPDALRLRLGLSNERIGPEREVSTALAPRSFLDVLQPPRQDGFPVAPDFITSCLRRFVNTGHWLLAMSLRLRVRT